MRSLRLGSNSSPGRVSGGFAPLRPRHVSSAAPCIVAWRGIAPTVNNLLPLSMKPYLDLAHAVATLSVQPEGSLKAHSLRETNIMTGETQREWAPSPGPHDGAGIAELPSQ